MLMLGTQSATAATHRSPVLLFVGRPNLQIEILAQFLSHALQIRCGYAQNGVDRDMDEPAVLLFDCKNLHQDDICDRFERLSQQSVDIRAVLFNVTPHSSCERLLHWHSVRGIFFEDCNQHLLLKGMRAVLDGDLWIPRRLLEQAFERQRCAISLTAHSNIKLSRRECDILNLVASACSNTAIATRLHISEHTVKSHLYNIFRKTGVRNRTEASHWAMLHLSPVEE